MVPFKSAIILKSKLPAYTSFHDLPIDELNKKKYSIYVIDYDWNYLFANEHAIVQTGGMNLIGKNIRTVWNENPGFKFEPVYNLLRENIEQKRRFDLKSRSPVTRKAIEIVGHPLSDCYYFSVYELPDKESLLQELKRVLKRS